MEIIPPTIEHTLFALAGIILVAIGYLSLCIIISDRERIEQLVSERIRNVLRDLTLLNFAILLPSVSGLLHIYFYTQQTEFLLKVSIGILWIVILYINLSMIIVLWKADFRPKFKKELVDYAFYFAVLWVLFEELNINLVNYIIPGAIFTAILFYVIISMSRIRENGGYPCFSHKPLQYYFLLPDFYDINGFSIDIS